MLAGVTLELYRKCSDRKRLKLVTNGHLSTGDCNTTAKHKREEEDVLFVGVLMKP